MEKLAGLHGKPFHFLFVFTSVSGFLAPFGQFSVTFLKPCLSIKINIVHMKIRPEELTENGYVLLDKLGHKELVPFIRTYMKKRTKYSVFYYLSNVIVFGLVGYFFVQGYNLPNYSFGDRFTYFSYGLAIAFALLPLHEYIHVLAYKSQGATNTSYDANLKKFYFMALADKFVANKREFEIVALAPFTFITTTLIIFLFVADNNWNLTISSVLLAHTAMCSGDFGLLSFFDFHKDKEPITYDDVENKISYFYGKNSETKTN
ncbi:MAG: DUF3267 domain-containing protein [Saprospiraceae bacterium]|nr:DUF3267 domain-containing protein [Candidatus Vicinibacter affinis]